MSSLRKGRHGLSRLAYAGIIVVIIAVLASASYIALTPATPPVTSTVTSVSTQIVTTSQTTTTRVLRVALIMEGPQLDGSYNQIISTNLAQIVNESKGTVTASYIDNTGPSDVQRVSSTYGQQGYDLIVGDANDLGPGMAVVAPQFPKSDFSVFGGNVLGPNLGSFVLWANEGGYVAGYLAGLLTHTGKVGTIVAFKYQSQVAWTNGYLQGVKKAAQETKQNITVTNGWTSTWTDPAIGSQSAKSMLSAGIDVISEDASGPGSGMQTAVQAAFQGAAVGPYAMGAFVNQNSLGPFMVASVPWNFKPVLQTIIQQVRDGSFGGKITQYFLHDNAMTLTMSNTVPAAVQTKVSALISSIISGQTVVPLVQTPDLNPTGTTTVP